MDKQPKPKPAIAYIRVARKEQLTLEQQRDEVYKYAEEQGDIVVSDICDVGVSGLKNADAVNKILHEADQNHCDTTMCLRPESLSRDPVQLMSMLSTLEENSVSVECVQVPMPTADECNVLRTFFTNEVASSKHKDI